MADRFDFAALEDWLIARRAAADEPDPRDNREGPRPSLSLRHSADLLDVDSVGSVWRYRRHGLGWRLADELAVRVGLHPALVWSAWFDDRGEPGSGGTGGDALRPL